MTLIHQLQTLYHRFLSIGVTQELSFSEKLRTELCNQFIIFAFPSAIFHLVYNFLTDNHLRGYILVGLWVCVMSFTLLLNYHKKYLLARFFISIFSFSVIAACHILFGWEQRLDFMYLLFVLIGYYILERNLAIILIAFILLTYIGIAAYLSFFGPIFKVQVIASGTYAYFVFAVIITMTLTARVLRENYRYNQITIEQNKVLETQNEELERFTYIASHDLKSPVSNIMGFSEIIQEELEDGNYELVQQYLTHIQTSAKRMSYLIEDILELSKVRNGNKEKKEWVDCNKIVETAKQCLIQAIERKNVQIICQDLPTYYCNETEFSLVFQNLMQNGIKYNKSTEPTIEIWSSQSKNALFLYFKDNGIGIEEKYHAQIFEYFKRLHNQTEYEGTGIGLGLCRRIVENYNGSISVESNLNQGSTFILKLPLSI